MADLGGSDFTEEFWGCLLEIEQLQVPEDPTLQVEKEFGDQAANLEFGSTPSSMPAEIDQGPPQTFMPSSSSGSTLQCGQEVAEALKITMPPMIQGLVAEALKITMPPMIQGLVAEALKITMPPMIQGLVAEALKITMPPMIQGLFAEEVKITMQPMIQGLCAEAMETTIQTLISKLVEEIKKTVHPSGLRSRPDQAAPRSLRLRFMGTMPDTLYTGTNIQDSGASLTVELCDSSRSRVEVGPEASAKVRLLVLDGDSELDDKVDWTEEEFKKYKVKPRKEKGSLLKGNSEIYLENGVADVTDIAFTDNSKSMRNGTFRLGAELVDGVAREAVSEKAFKVKERRGRPSHGDSLSLEDSTHSLRNIGPKVTERLESANIRTVKDFLQLRHTDPKVLRNILQIAENKLSETVKHAESCPLTDELYSYDDETEGVHLVLDCVFNVKGVTFNGQTSQTYETLDDFQKERVNGSRHRAYEKREMLKRTCAVTNPMSVELKPVGPSGVHATAGNQAYASNDQAVIDGTDGPGTKVLGLKWKSILLVVFFRISIKVPTKQGPRAAKRQKTADTTLTLVY